MRTPLLRSGLVAVSSLMLVSGPASAHTFGTGTDAFEAFVEGSNAVVFSPYALLPCLSLGLLLTLWQIEGMLRAWPALIAGHLIGFGLAPLVGIWIIPVLVATGLVVAVLAALWSGVPRLPRAAVASVAGEIGLLTLLTSLEEHSWLELSVPIYLGIFAGASFSVAAGAGIARVVLEKLRYGWVRIALRIAASWLAAMQVLMLAFLLAPSA